MEKFILKFKSSYIGLIILLLGALYLGFILIATPREVPILMLQCIGLLYFMEAITYGMDICIKILRNKLNKYLKEVDELEKYGNKR